MAFVHSFILFLAISSWIQKLFGLKMLFGVQYTGLFIWFAKFAVIKLQDFFHASGINIALDNPAIMRFLCGKV